MKKKLKLFLRQFFINIGIIDDLSVEERFTQFIVDQKHNSLLDRIKEIRNNSLYEPDYNKPKSFTDLEIYYNATPDNSKTLKEVEQFYLLSPEYKPITHLTKLAQERPEDFGSDITKWRNSILLLDHTNEDQLFEAKQKAFKEYMDKRNPVEPVQVYCSPCQVSFFSKQRPIKIWKTKNIEMSKSKPWVLTTPN